MKRIFKEHMSELYWLAFLLTGDRERSVQAFTGALQGDAVPPAFESFMLAWARKLVIVSALGTMRRELRESALRIQPGNGANLAGLGRLVSIDEASLSKQDLEEALLAMDVFPRCAVILTLLEGLPVKEAAGMLGADQSTVKAAQARGVSEMTWRMADAIGPLSRRPFSFDQPALVAFG
jgi:DNA-directed RNA polymerase specialized sigma24 family protein